MNYKLSLSIITISAIVLGGCTRQDAPQTVNEQVSEAKELATALQSGQPTYCLMTKGEDKLEYWIKGKMFKMQGITTIQDEETGKTTKVESQIVSDNSYVYSWSNQNKQGFKMKIPTKEEIDKMTEDAKKYEDIAPKFDDEQGYESLKNEGYSINCKKDSVNDSSFIPPSDINFVDPTEMMQQFTGQTGQIDMQKLQDMAKQYENMGDPTEQ